MALKSSCAWNAPSSIRAPRSRLQNGFFAPKISTRTFRARTVAEQESLTSDEGESLQFMFHAQAGGKVNVCLRKQNAAYLVIMEATFSDDQAAAFPVNMFWGLFRSDSAQWMLLEPEVAPSGTRFVSEIDEAMETPLHQCSPNCHALEFQVPSGLAPFYISFLLHSPATQEHEDLWIRRKNGANFCIPIGMQVGCPDPLGITWLSDASVNFALYSKNATGVSLCLYNEGDTEPTMEVDLDPSLHRTGDVWHVQLDTTNYTRYGYRCKGDPSWDGGSRFNLRCILLDPYATVLAPPVPGQEDLPSPATALGWLKDCASFDWEDDLQPCIPLERLIAYRLNVGGFTESPSSDVPEESRGTYLGLIEKIPYLKCLGVNAVILQPIFAFDKARGQFHPLSYFSPSEAYAPKNDSSAASTSLKMMIKALHRSEFEVILDVVYSHTAENGDDDPRPVSFRGIDNATYYVLDEKKRILKSETGTNIFNCNHPAVHRMILDSLRYWVQEYHVDGFSFANAPVLVKGPHGQDLSRPLLLEAVAFDPMLSKVKLIADALCCSKPVRIPHWNKWSESSTDFHSVVKRFFRGDKGLLGRFATRLCVSEEGRGVYNYVANAYGLTLADGLSYSEVPGSKAPQYSWNCGEEGPSFNQAVQETRARQTRNLLVTLFLSQGVPVLHMGDEYGHSNCGTFSKDRQFDWAKSRSRPEMSHLISVLASFRSTHKNLLQGKLPVEITWYGPHCEEPQWCSLESSFLAVKREAGSDGLYVAFNADQDEGGVEVIFPEPPQGASWSFVGDTSLPHPGNFVLNSSSRPGKSYQMQPSSVLVLEARYDYAGRFHDTSDEAH